MKRHGVFAKKKMETKIYSHLQSVLYYARQRRDIVRDSPQQLIVFFAVDDKRGPPTDKTTASLGRPQPARSQGI